VPQHRNYLSVADYPHPHLPRYATGNFYILSIDLVHYIAMNGAYLKTVGSLEDVSIAVWMSGIAVRIYSSFFLTEYCM
jgi:hypothetical protein